MVGTEYLTSNTKIAYPFREDSLNLSVDGYTHDAGAAVLPMDMIVDAVVSQPQDCTFVVLGSIMKQGATTFRFVFRGDIGTITYFDVDTNDFIQTFQVFGNDLLDVPVKLVLNTAVALDYLSTITTSDVFGNDGLKFEARTLIPVLSKVDTLELYTELPVDPEPEAPGSITGDVVLQAGYNIVLELQDDGAISLDAQPGAGQGIVACEDIPTPPKSKGLMALIPDQNGNIKFKVGDDQCYNLIPIPSTGHFTIQGSCTAGCSCDDYDNVAMAVRKLLYDARDARVYLDNARGNLTPAQIAIDLALPYPQPQSPTNHDNYQYGVSYFNEKIAILYGVPTLVANGAKGADWSQDPAVRCGAANWATVTLTLKNSGKYTFTPTSDLVLTVGSPASVAVRQVNWEYNKLAGNFPSSTTISLANLLATVGVIARGKSVVIHFLMYYPYNPAQVIGSSWAGSATVTGTVDALTPYAKVLTSTFSIT